MAVICTYGTGNTLFQPLFNHHLHHYACFVSVFIEYHTLEPTCMHAAPTEADMGVLASHLAAELQPGDCYCLYGDVGAGKSVFSRAFIRAAAEDPELPVPSPTYVGRTRRRPTDPSHSLGGFESASCCWDCVHT